jgi:lipopolysaccharide transport system permease protein
MRRDLLVLMVSRNLKIRYKNSTLGFFWSLLGPLFLIGIYTIFLRVMRFPIDLPALVTGILVWQFLALCLGDSLHAVVGNANLVTKAKFPRLILPLSMVLANLVNFLFSSLVLVAYLVAVRAHFGPLYWLPLIVLSQFALCLGMAMIFSAANVFFRDTEHILSIVMLAWFFLTPVIYTVTEVTGSFPPFVHYLFFANPMTGILSAYRTALLSAKAMPPAMTALSFAVAWCVLWIGVVVFQRSEPRFGDEL